MFCVLVTAEIACGRFAVAPEIFMSLWFGVKEEEHGYSEYIFYALNGLLI
jgi:hypothetical protein